MQARLSLTRKISKAGFHPFILMIIMPLVNKLLSRILANIMDQLGDLGRHAVDIMDGIGLELCTYPTTRIPNSSVTQKVSVCLSRKRCHVFRQVVGIAGGG